LNDFGTTGVRKRTEETGLFLIHFCVYLDMSYGYSKIIYGKKLGYFNPIHDCTLACVKKRKGE